MKPLYLLNRLHWSWRGKKYRFHYHSQNLNEKHDHRYRLLWTGSQWREGRAWLNFNVEHSHFLPTLAWSWNFLRRSNNLALKLEFNTMGEKDIQLHLSIPFLAGLWIGLEHLPKWVRDRLPHVMKPSLIPATESVSGHVEYDHSKMWAMPRTASTGFSIHNGYIWLDWMYDWTGYPGGGKHWSWNFTDFFLGKEKYTKEEHESFHNIDVPMPEATYQVDITFETATWKRPRWPWPKVRHGASYEVKNKGGIPFPGKGENSWDCGMDGLRGGGANATTLDGVIGAIIKSVSRDRARYGWSLESHLAYGGKPGAWVEPD